MPRKLLRSPHYILGLLVMGSLFFACENDNQLGENLDQQPGQVKFSSSDTSLQKSWEWAKKTALSYVREDSIVGLWYEAALPGRDAFCMRDVSHQANGAAVLGLQDHTKNMLRLFAKNISESKDWCSYWEIDKLNRPAPVDYKNDKDFWYNLPANFDVMDACFRMYEWTGDVDYIEDPVFKNFYEKSLNEYVDRWDLSANSIMKRDRIMNLPEGATPDKHHYYDRRGIPGYHEAAGGKMQVGVDLLALLYAAYNGYHQLMVHQEPSTSILNEINELDSLINQVFWDIEKNSFRIIYYQDGRWGYSVGDGADFSHSLLHYYVLTDSVKIESILDNYCNNKESLIIELASHMPEIFFRYGRPDDGIFMLKHLTDSSTYRRKYPENPYAVTGAFATGLMGIYLNADQNLINTFSGLTDASQWGLMEDLPVFDGSIDLLHQGRHTSVLTNHTEDTLHWISFFNSGPEEWYINNDPSIHDGAKRDIFGTEVIAWFNVVKPGETISITAIPPKQE